MPSWIKKRFQVLKNDLINHLIVTKNQKQILLTRTPTTAHCDNSNSSSRHNDIANSYNNNEQIASNVSKKVRIRRIRNDLHTNRFSNKTDMNAYNDYTKWRDQVLINQNNCALRCIRREPDEVEVKIINTDKIDTTTHCPNGANATHNNNNHSDNSVRTVENRQMRCDYRTVAMAVASSNHYNDAAHDDGGRGRRCDGNDDATCDNECESMNSTNAYCYVLRAFVCALIYIQSKHFHLDKEHFASPNHFFSHNFKYSSKRIYIFYLCDKILIYFVSFDFTPFQCFQVGYIRLWYQK